MAKDMYKYFEDLALTMYKNSVWCGVVRNLHSQEKTAHIVLTFQL